MRLTFTSRFLSVAVSLFESNAESDDQSKDHVGSPSADLSVSDGETYIWTNKSWLPFGFTNNSRANSFESKPVKT